MIYLLLIIFCFILFLFLEEIININRSINAKNWKECEGKLEKWKMRTETDSEHTTFHVDHILYSYNVNGKEFHSSLIGYGFPSWMNTLYLGNIIRTVFSNSPIVKVMYKPSSPGNSVLVTGFQRYHFIKLITYIFLVIFLTIILLEKL